MRPILIALLLTLPACTTMRKAAGAYSDFADKGISMKTGAGDGASAAPTPEKKKAAPLPDGLVGDGQTHVYAEPSPRSS